MLRLAAFSDLHADLMPDGRGPYVLEQLAKLLHAAEVDVVLIAGDQVNHHSQLTRYLAPLAVGRLANLYLPGNHDVWLSKGERERGMSSFEALVRLEQGATAAGFHYLPGHPRLMGGWAFAGNLGWYDYSFADPALPATPEMYASKRWFGRVVWNDIFAAWREQGRPLSDAQVAERLLAQMRADLGTLGLSTRGGPPTVVASHMLPYRALLRYADVVWNFCNAFMGSVALGALYDGFPAIRLVVAGHTHAPRRLELGGRQVVVSPFGYHFLGEFPADLRERVALFDLTPDGRALPRPWSELPTRP